MVGEDSSDLKSLFFLRKDERLHTGGEQPHLLLLQPLSSVSHRIKASKDDALPRQRGERAPPPPQAAPLAAGTHSVSSAG